MIGSLSRKYVRAGKFLMPYCLASRLSLILTKSTPKWSVSSSIFSSSANTLSHVVQLLASGISQYQLNINHNSSNKKYLFIFSSFLWSNTSNIVQQNIYNFIGRAISIYQYSFIKFYWNEKGQNWRSFRRPWKFTLQKKEN